ncbi:MAG: H4MPT-linked C1 transfer pathway protein [Proteobacteria bacterium]|nr:H4MPT-linked C1 transfer pathway protein [Pseudomonadota bacterium]
MPESMTGWDVGGAHLKVVEAIGAARVSRVVQVPCELWKGLDQLHTSIDQVWGQFDFSHSMLAVTMTGELVDHFGSRKEGIDRIVETIGQRFKENEIVYFAGPKGFVHMSELGSLSAQVASANWLASGNFIATRLKDALVIDIGSTTTDVLSIRDHRVVNEGYTDSERLHARELVYCGVVRTPVFALCSTAQVGGRLVPPMNEYFANSADVYRLTGELPSYADTGSTPDGRGKDQASSAIRLARMFGNDAATEQLEMWRAVAAYVREQQIQVILDACRKQMLRTGLGLDSPVAGAGAGRFLVREISRRLNRRYVDVADLFEHEGAKDGLNAGDCVPAASIACLGYQRYCL